MKPSWTSRWAIALRCVVAGIGIGLFSELASDAATLSWSGGGSSGNWNDTGNWGFAGVPANGDTLIFPGAQPRLINTNNLASLILNQVRFVGASGGYAIFGNAITITNGIEATNSAGANVLSNSVTLGSPGDFSVNVSTGARLTLGGTLSGSVGLVKKGGGTNTLAGGFSNTYGGTTTVNAGLVELSKFGVQAAAIPHDLIVGDGVNSVVVRNLAGAEVADVSNVSVNRFSTWDLADHNETITALTMTGGTVTTGTNTGTLTLGGNLLTLSSSTSSTISGKLALGSVTRTFSVSSGSASPDLLISADISGGAGAGITKTSLGQMTLSGSNTYTGPTTVDGFLILLSDTALGASGSSTNGTVINTNGFLLVQDANVIDEFLTLNTGVEYRSSGTATWSGPITLNGDITISTFAGTFTNSGAITGSGGITKINIGTLIYAGSSVNTYSGGTIVNEGILQLAKTVATAALVNGTLTIGDDLGGSDADVVRELGPNQINSSIPITINSSGLLDLNGFNDAIGALTFSGGHLSTGTGVATLTGSITANANTNNLARIDGLASISGARTFNVAQGTFSPDIRVTASVSGVGGITKIGPGELSLNASNSYSGLTTISNGFVDVRNSFALGSTNAGTIVSGGAVLGLLSGVHVGLEPLTLSGNGNGNVFGALSSSFGSNSWDGAITLDSNTTFSTIAATDTLNLAGPIGGTGDVTKIGPGTLIFSGGAANTYSGSTFINEGTNLLSKSFVDGAIPHDLFVGDGTGGALSDVVQIIGIPQIASVANVTVASSGLLDFNDISDGISTLSGFGRVDLGSSGAGGVILNGNGSATYSGTIVGVGGDVTKNGTGTFTLTGANSYSGLTRVNTGKVIVNGSQPLSSIVIGASGTLGGDGTVGNITNIVGGVIAPGSSTAILTSSNVVCSGVSSDFTVELNGTVPGSGYDQLNVRGIVSLGGSTLNVIPAFSPLDSPANGTQFTIINNDGADAVTGTFAGLADNAVFTAGGLQFRINYADTFGNDVFLTLTNVALAAVSTVISGGNGDGIIQPNECNLLNVVITNVAGALVTNISATLLSKTPGVSVVQASAAYPNIAANGRGTNATPFQISLAPGFVCGQNIDLLLAVATANQGSFSIPLVLTSGSAGGALAFSNLGIKIIPDGGTTNSTVSVVGITAPIANVTVSLNINHGSDGDLDLFLQAPDGTIVELSTDNGGTGNNYGNSCAQRTTFDDAALTPITSGAVPYFGTFRPEGKLSDFRGKSGTNINGTWKLLVTDDTVNAVGGELDCWTLNLFPATCVPGSGACELCPNLTLSGALGSNSLQQAARLNRDGIVSVCGVAKTCPGPLGSGTRSYDAYTFRNGPSNACITVALTGQFTDLFSAAYTNGFNPTNLCLNYLADQGTSTTASPTPKTYSFNASSNATFVVVVAEVTAGDGGAYVLNVTGGECRPVLNITPANASSVALDWTTAAAGFALESTNNLAGSNPWPPVPTVPVVVNGRFQVTNSITTSNQFYRLRKPVP